jgi:hypothetical protein
VRLSRPARLILWFALLLAVLAGAGFAVFYAVQHSDEPVVDVHRAGPPTMAAIHFGGPDRPVGALSALLRNRIDAVPPGGRIAWATYYFRDLDLARALIRASDRGVRVTLVVDGDPRFESANQVAIQLLRRHGLAGGLVVRQPAPPPFDAIAGRLHSKIYMFSDPQPVALIGSFNPSGDEQTDRATLEEIGDQDRGHNLLAEVTGRGLVAALEAHVHALAAGGGSVDRFAASDNRTYRDSDTELFFYPRLRPYVTEQSVAALRPGDRLWGAISHLKAGMVDRIAAAARRGVIVDLVVHDTERRVPTAAVDELREAGASVRRYRRPDHLPMHAKFIVMDSGGRLTSYLGSLNYNRNSRWLNDEVLVRTADRRIALTLLARYAEIEREIDALDRR